MLVQAQALRHLDAVLSEEDQFATPARAYHRILKVARTIADLANRVAIAEPHVAEAVAYRRFDRM